MEPDAPLLNRRRFLKAAAGSAAAAGFSASRAGLLDAQQPQQSSATEHAGLDVTGDVTNYVANGPSANVPADVLEATKHHVLDTFAAMVSGSTLKPGQFALKHVQAEGGNPEAQVVASRVVTSTINAAFANAMMAHSDETDDSHRKTLVHPGAAIVPAALAMAEHEDASGARFLKSVIVGYDIGCRIILALDPDQLLQGSGATPGIGGCIGAAAACASVAGMERSLIPYCLSFAIQQASGINSWMRDKEHMEKAFVFAGMPARNGVTAVQVVQAGFTGESDPFSGPDNIFKAFSAKPDPGRLIAGLGREYEVMQTDMKRFPVGFPIQAPTDALLKLLARGLTASNMRSLTVRLPAPGVHTVNDRNMPDVNVQYILAAILIDGSLKFETAHSLERMRDAAVLDVKKRIVLEEDTELTAQKRTREANLEVVKTDGTTLKEHGVCKGTIELPMTRDEVAGKAGELMTPVLGAQRTRQLIQRIWNIEEIKSMRELRPLLVSPT